MDVDKVNQWLMVTSHLGILAGLILVGMQIKQDNELTRLQIFSDTTTSRIQIHEAVMGDNPALVVMKSLTHPEDLTLEELRIMDAYLLAAVNEERRRMVLEESGLQVTAVEEEDLLLFYFGNEFAQAWWQQFMSDGENRDNHFNEEMIRRIESAAELNMTTDFFRKLGQRLNIKSTQDM